MSDKNKCFFCGDLEDGDLFDLDMYKCESCGNIFHCDCLGIEPDSPLDADYLSWWNDETDIEMDREKMPAKFCPLCRKDKG